MKAPQIEFINRVEESTMFIPAEFAPRLTSLSLHYRPLPTLEVWAEPQWDGTWVVKINDYALGFAKLALGVVDDFGSLVRDPTEAPSYVSLDELEIAA